MSQRAFDAVEKYGFGKRGRPRFKSWFKSRFKSRFKALLLVEGKSNATGIRWRDGRVEWAGLVLKPLFDRKDKHGVQINSIGEGDRGLDIGPSTLTVGGEREARLEQFCPSVEFLGKKIRRIQRARDQSGQLQRGRDGENRRQALGVFSRIPGVAPQG